jgi:hypothetical protein
MGIMDNIRASLAAIGNHGAHFLAGMVGAVMIAPFSLEWALFGGAALGVIKEIYDRASGTGKASIEDALVTVVGAVLVVVPAHFLAERGWWWIAVLYTVWAFFFLYLVMMAYYRALLRGRLGGEVVVLGTPVLVLAFAIDVLVQMTVACIVFREPPREFLFSNRLRRHKANANVYDWRRMRAAAICEKILDPFDPTGDHCD